MILKTQDVFYRLALHRVKGIGPLRYKKIIEGLDDISILFSSTKKFLKNELSLPVGIVNAISGFNEFDWIEKELKLIEKNKIHVLHFDQENYPTLLKNCIDAPALLFFQGNMGALNRNGLSVIGTRQPSDYGRKQCQDIVSELARHPITIISGLAYGIDAIAHRTALEHQLPTIGVMAHGLGEMYPVAHKQLAQQMLEHGGIMTEYFFHTKAGRDQFPARNRIVAGVSEATIIIETAVRGGSMITADMAYSYNRDVLCVPGRIGDTNSTGCNLLIKQMKGQLISGSTDIIDILGWTKQEKKTTQRKLFLQLSEEEEELVKILEKKNDLHIDELSELSSMNTSKCSSAILSLELQGIVLMKPGKVVSLI